MSTPIEKIDVEKVRGEYVNMTMPEVTGLSYGFQERGDDTTQSLKLLAEKINEICDVLNSMRVENPYSDNIGKIEYAAPQNIIPPEVVK